MNEEGNLIVGTEKELDVVMDLFEWDTWGSIFVLYEDQYERVAMISDGKFH